MTKNQLRKSWQKKKYGKTIRMTDIKKLKQLFLILTDELLKNTDEKNKTF